MAERRLRRFALAAALAALPAAIALAADAEPLVLQARSVEPRAFGYRAGDIVEREVAIDVPDRLVLDDATLPTVGPQGPVIELRSLQRRSERIAGGRRLHLRLRYQLFASPVAVKAYELPSLKLRFEAAPGAAEARAEDLRVESWPVVVGAIGTEEASPREGLGALRPDVAPPPRPTAIEHAVLQACAGAAALIAAYLAFVYAGLPWSNRRRRPFSQAYAAVRAAGAADWRAACLALHQAFDRTAGRTVFAAGIDAFVAQAPRFAGLGEDIRAFYARSQAAFFAGDAGGAAAPPRDWLLAFARACRDAERGSGGRQGTR